MTNREWENYFQESQSDQDMSLNYNDISKKEFNKYLSNFNYFDMLIGGIVDDPKDDTTINISQSELEINKKFKKIYDLSDKESVYFKYCSFSTYRNTFKDRLKDHRINSPSNYEVNFIEKEAELLENLRLFSLCNIQNGDIIKNDCNLKIKFLDDFAEEHGVKIKVIKRKETDILNSNKFQIDIKYIENSKSMELQHPKVFMNSLGYALFMRLKEAYENSPTKLAEFSYVYLKMKEDKFIHDDFKPMMFIKWLNDEFEIPLDKLKTLSQIGNKEIKEDTYNLHKQLSKETKVPFRK